MHNNICQVYPHHCVHIRDCETNVDQGVGYEVYHDDWIRKNVEVSFSNKGKELRAITAPGSKILFGICLLILFGIFLLICICNAFASRLVKIIYITLCLTDKEWE